MDDNTNPAFNPFDPSLPTAPFVGRVKAFEFLYHHLTSPDGPQTAAVTGAPASGKTALLRRFDTVFDDTFVGVYLPAPTALEGEAAWLAALTEAVTQALAARRLPRLRLPAPSAIDGISREWFRGMFLPAALTSIRRGRRLIFLIDDAEALADAIAQGALPPDALTFLDGLRGAQVGFVLALNARDEDPAALARLSPLLRVDAVFRLTRLQAEDAAALLSAAPLTRSDEAAAALYRLTGGFPRWMQRAAFHLYRRVESSAARPPDSETVRAITPLVFTQSAAEITTLWEACAPNERLVLTAISRLLYADPLRPATAAAVESWLLETEYPLDSTAIYAALRALEYRELLTGGTERIQISAGLVQLWLLENAHLDRHEAALASPERPADASASAPPRPDWLLPALIVGLAALLLVVLVAAVGGNGSSASATPPPPTVTLATAP